jgi:hypothetical protein
MMRGHDIVDGRRENPKSAVEEINDDDGEYRERCKLAGCPHLCKVSLRGYRGVTSLRTIRLVILRFVQHAQVGLAAIVKLWGASGAPDPSGRTSRDHFLGIRLEGRLGEGVSDGGPKTLGSEVVDERKQQNITKFERAWVPFDFPGFSAKFQLSPRPESSTNRAGPNINVNLESWSGSRTSHATVELSLANILANWSLSSIK